MVFDQETLGYVTVMKLGFISMEGGTRLSVVTSYIKVKECGRRKRDSEHHYGACYLSLPEMMGNASCHP